MKFTYFIGIDVSKKTFNAAIIPLSGKNILAEAVFSNTQSGFKQFYQWLISQLGKSQLSHLVICLEHTGLYDLNLSYFFHKKSLSYSHHNALKIKKSLGIVRGKSDKVDARRIAFYIRKERDQLSLSSPAQAYLIQLHRLFSMRELMVKHKRALKQHYASIEVIKGDYLVKKLRKTCDTMIRQHQKRIEQMDAEIKVVIKTNSSLAHNYKLLLSVPGIGHINASHLLITTRNFTAFRTWRQYATYAGTAPFGHQSGTSIKGAKKVNHFANKKAKALLTTAAKVAKKHDFELKSFYEKKIQEGKNKFWIINAIRNKIISRAFAVIDRKSPYKSVDQFQKWSSDKAVA